MRISRQIVLFFIGFLVFSYQSLPQIKPALPMKTYYYATVEDIMIRPYPFKTTGEIEVGVRLKFTKYTYLPGVPGQKLCDCAFEGPADEQDKIWRKVISLRLIGIKYSETETNLLEYSIFHRATPLFMEKTYGGFPIIGFPIYEEELKRGSTEIWGWVPKKNPPEEGREFKIYATLDVNGYRPQKDDDPDYLKKGCFPQGGDFAKTFKPQLLSIPKVSRETLSKSVDRIKETLPKLPDLNVVLTLEQIRSEKDSRMQNYLSADLYIEVRNIGNAPSIGVNILVERQCPSRGNQRQTIAKKRIKGLKAGEKDVISVEIDNKGCHPYNDAYFTVTVDPDNKVTELDETNNVSQIKLKGRASIKN